VSDRHTLAQLEAEARGAFAGRHIGPSAADVEHMLATIGQPSLAALSEAAVPEAIWAFERLSVPEAATEADVLAELRALAARNRPLRTMVGLGYHASVTPPVLVRNIVEDPAWYTAYTPYQPEISQGRLEALLNFQTMVADLTGLATANASMLDEATAAAEAVALFRRQSKAPADAAVVVDADCLPQTIAVVRTRCEPLGLPVVVTDLAAGPDALPPGDVFGVLLPSPGASGRLVDWAPLIDAAHDRGALVAVVADILALCLVTPPGEQGADVACGTTQRFGVPLGFGGPHAGYLAVRAGLERSLPGRLVGVSVDADGHPATRLALQTREQHIRRERATSNICTAQVLLAVLASMYAVYHGPDGLRRIAERVHRGAAVLAHGLRSAGVEIVHDAFFDTVVARAPRRADAVVAAALDAGINLRRVDADHVAVACDETTDAATVTAVWHAFGHGEIDLDAVDLDAPGAIPAALARTSPYLEHPVFSAHRSETAMLRYLRRLSDRDIALDRSMIPLGSCTMKLNATAEMAAITWPGFADLHPLAPLDQADGYRAVIADVERWLCEITGYDAVSLQPNAGSQGELAGLLAIRAWHRSRGDDQRDICLIPASAHGTNAASAVMGGMRVVVVACDGRGDVDLAALRAALAGHEGRVAAIMVTYPSTHGVFEAGIAELCALVHDAGGQVYVDGANLNALVGLAKPGHFGADVSHLNLHKTFCIPHGGGGPGVGPVAVRAHLAPYLPNHPLVAEAGPATGVGPVAGAPWGSAGILPVPWAYIRLMGPDGLRRATEVAILAANYVARRLAGHYPVLYTGRDDLVAHECILDLRPLTAATGVTGEDIAKRLIDHGFHAPTMSFPVAGTLMIEPTESEDLAELDRFVDAMLAIRAEIDEVPDVVRDAPFTAESLLVEPWDRPYTRAQAGYPAASQRGPHGAKYWPPVRRVASGHGDRNLVCSCPPLDAYDQADS
jgi:glycine dehydrogenase